MPIPSPASRGGLLSARREKNWVAVDAMIYAETGFCLFQINCGQLLYETEQFFERLN